MSDNMLVLATMDSYYRRFEAIGRNRRDAYRLLYAGIACYCEKNKLNFDAVFNLEGIHYKDLKLGQVFLDDELIYEKG